MSDVIVAPETRELGLLSDQLREWLGSKIAGGTDIVVCNLAYPRGAGLSHETILFDASWSVDGVRHEQGCVVRIKPVLHTVFPDLMFDEQYELMVELHRQGNVRVARPLWFEATSDLLGAPFFVMEKKLGRVPVSIPPYSESGWVAEATAEQRARMWENGVRQLAAIQKTQLSSVQFLKGKKPGAEQGLEQEWDKFVRFADWVQGDRYRSVLQAGLQKLRDSWPKNQPPGLVWGDSRLGNMMFDENFEVVAVMDWEQPSLGGALHDLAWWLVLSDMWHCATPTRSYLTGMGTREDTIALWGELTGISTDDIEWYEEFTQFKLSCLAIRTMSLRGMPAPEEASLAARLKIELVD